MTIRRLYPYGFLLCASLAPMIVPAQQRVATDAAGARTDNVLARPVTVRIDNLPLRRAVNALADSANVQVYYRQNLLDSVRSAVTLHATQLPLGLAFDRLLAGTNLRVLVSAGGVLTIREGEGGSSAVQGIVIQGRVTNAKTKQPVRGAVVSLDNDAKGVATADDGSFRLTASAGEHVVSVRALGLLKQSRRVTVADGQSMTADFALETGTSVLDEVVVTGTVVATERKAIPTPITVITAEDIEKRGITRVEEFFRGEIPGVIALEKGSLRYSGENSTGGPTFGAMVSSDIYARGSSGLGNSGVGTTTPLKTFVDGIEMLNASYLGTIDPKSIERIEIITGPQAATIYGSGAMGGVMQIFTKKGVGRTTPDITISSRYGMMESNLSSSRTPIHNHSASLTGGAGPMFSYSANVSYNYSGQWQPALFNQSIGASVGATHTRGPVTVSGSVSTMSGRNGTAGGYDYLLYRTQAESGEWLAMNGIRPTVQISQRISTSSSQTVALNADYQMAAWWQHHVTFGKSQTEFTSIPERPRLMQTWDTLFSTGRMSGQRITTGYNTTLLARPFGAVSSTLTLGANGSSGSQMSVTGCTATRTSSNYLACPYSTSVYDVRVYQYPRDRSWGGFGSWQLGLFDRLYFTMGLRGERNPTYGQNHAIDWTPTNGVTYTIEHGDLTLKLLASYGRATRAPSPSYREEGYTTNASYDPQQYLVTFANPDLTPEYSRGPQGGFELYYGNVGSLTINRYRQTITNLIQGVVVDSIQRIRLSDNVPIWTTQRQFQNVAKVGEHGWEATGALNVGPLSFKGTYSWTDSRILSVNPRTGSAATYTLGASYRTLPSHTANVTASYAHGRNSVTLVTNYVGSSLQANYDGMLYQIQSRSRLKMYIPRKNVGLQDDLWSQPGYVKSDLSASHRLTPWASFTLNVVNLGDSYGSDVSHLNPVLGRQTFAGVSLKFPRTR